MTMAGLEFMQKTEINGRAYRIPYALEQRVESGQLSWHRKPVQMKVVNECAHCGRSDWREVVAFSVDELVSLGWLIPEDELP